MRITILGDPIQYNGFLILVQNIGNLFQAVIFDPKDMTVRQLYNEISNNNGAKHTTKTLRNAYAWTMQQAAATCDLILSKGNSDKLIEGKEREVEIVRILDNAQEVNEKDQAKRKAQKSPTN